MTERISMVHGSGGSATAALISEIFAKEFQSPLVDAMEDAAVVEGASHIAITTDSFVVKPLFYPGGDIGRLAACGTVNDLLMRGAVPKYITAGFILEEGAAVSDIRRIARSLAETADEAGVVIVCGDTKVIEGSGGIMINTTGVGFVADGVEVMASGARPGDVILVSGTMGDHHATILSSRLAVENNIKSDNAPLVEMAGKLRRLRAHSLRDVTRGGLATVLKELAEASKMTFTIDEAAVPVLPEVKDFCGILGLNPLYMGNEGKLVCVVDPEDADAALEVMRSSRYGERAEKIGVVVGGGESDLSRSGDFDAALSEDFGMVKSGEPGTVFARTAVGGLRKLAVLQDEGLPRIC